MEWLEGLKGIVAIEQRACKGNSLLLYAYTLRGAYPRIWRKNRYYSILPYFISTPSLSYCLRLPVGGSVSVMRTTAFFFVTFEFFPCKKVKKNAKIRFLEFLI